MWNRIAFCLISLAAIGLAQTPISVSVCQLKQHPEAYNHKLVAVTAFASHGFEDFTLFDPECPSWPQVWLEYGGTVSSDTVYCCGPTARAVRPKPLSIEGISVPLVDDAPFQAFGRALRQRPTRLLRAQLVGRFFAGEAQRLETGRVWGRGFGHMGCCSLLVIQQVRDVVAGGREDLDEDRSPDQPQPGRAACQSQDFVPDDSYASSLAAQCDAEAGNLAWAFTDPAHAAVEALAHLPNLSRPSIQSMKVVRKSAGRIVYEWKPAGKRATYLVTASRPYWLSFYAKDPQRVAWVIIGAYESSCPAR